MLQAKFYAATLMCCVAVSIAITPSTLDCDSKPSCSPDACVINNEADCSFPYKAVDWSAEVASVSCKVCTASRSSKCAAAQRLLTGDGIKAVYVTGSMFLCVTSLCRYCNDVFLVVWSTGKPSYNANEYLQGIPLPPGGDDKCRVRTAAELLTVWKIPLDATYNPNAESYTVPNALPNVPGMPAAGAVGMAIDGVPMFPNYNNRGMPTWDSCEVDRCNAHSGKGEDYHYHGDPFGDKCLYSEADYSGDHPPIIGFALDGFDIYGRYTTATQSGITTELDACGGHQHDGVDGYHYHSTVTEGESASTLDGVSGSGPFSYTAYRLAPTTCWRGDVSSIQYFYNSAQRQVNYDRSKARSLAEENDYEQLRPCCGAASLYTAAGIQVDGSSSTSGTTPVAPTPATGTMPSAPVDCASYCASLSSPASSTSVPIGSPAGATSAAPPAAPIASTASNACAAGMDNKGKACPPDDSRGACPPGCELPSLGRRLLASVADFTGLFSTNNALPYMCPATKTAAAWACAQSEYPAGQNEGTTAELSCASGTIECLVFASVGKVGGSCSGDEFKEDPSGSWAYLPESVGLSCIGQSSCTIEQQQNSLNGVSFNDGSTSFGAGSAKFKVIAMCSGTSGSNSAATAEAPPAASSVGTSTCNCDGRPMPASVPNTDRGISEPAAPSAPVTLPDASGAAIVVASMALAPLSLALVYYSS